MKTFAKAPKPKSLEDYERQGPGHDTQRYKSTEPLKRLSTNMPASLHRRFKRVCLDNDLSMVGEVVTMIERRTAELEGR